MQGAFILVAPLVAYALCRAGPLDAAVDNSFYERPGVTASEILRARGYLAEDFFIETMGGDYMLKITRGRNPLISGASAPGGLPGKVPILFLHGILEDANVFVINSFDAKPSDLSQLDLATNATIEELNAKLGDLPSAKAMPLLAMDLGHEVFIMSRRGFPGSMDMGNSRRTSDTASQHINQQAQQSSRQSSSSFWADLLTSPGKYMLGPFSAYLAALLELPSQLQQVPISFNASFYNFSLDEQALYDLPDVVDFVLNRTGRAQTAVVAHSAGGAITLMSLAARPELANKIASATLWSEAFNVGDSSFFRLLPAFLPLLAVYPGSFPPAFLTDQLAATLALICSPPGAEYTLCEGIADALLGPSGFQEPLRPEFFSSVLGPTSPHELAQLIRAGTYPDRQVHMRDYGSSRANQLAYGRDKAPTYDLARIKLDTLSFYVGAGDGVVQPSDVARSIVQLRVPHRYHLIDTTFNHEGYFFHKNVSRLVIIPSMKEIVTLAQQRRRRQ